MEAAIADALPMVRAIVGLRARRLERDDATQDVVLWLIEKSLPRYDLALDVPLRAFLARCIFHRVCDLVRADRRRRDRERPSQVEQEPSLSIDDARVDELAERITTRPDDFLSPAEAKAVKALHKHPYVSRRELADLLGVRPCSLSRVLRRARAAVSEIAREELNSANA